MRSENGRDGRGESLHDHNCKIVGVSSGADEQELRRAFRNQARKVHPDVRPAEEKQQAEHEFTHLRKAYEALLRERGAAASDKMTSHAPAQTESKGRNWRETLEFSTPEEVVQYLVELTQAPYAYTLDKWSIIALKKRILPELWKAAEESEEVVEALANLMEKLIRPVSFTQMLDGNQSFGRIEAIQAIRVAKMVISSPEVWSRAETAVLNFPGVYDEVEKRIAEKIGFRSPPALFDEVFSAESLRSFESAPIVAEKLATSLLYSCVLYPSAVFSFEDGLKQRDHVSPTVWKRAMELLLEDPLKSEMETRLKREYFSDPGEVLKRLKILTTVESPS